MKTSNKYSEKVIEFAIDLFSIEEYEEAIEQASNNGAITNEEKVLDNLQRIEDNGGLNVHDL